MVSEAEKNSNAICYAGAVTSDVLMHQDFLHKSLDNHKYFWSEGHIDALHAAGTKFIITEWTANEDAFVSKVAKGELTPEKAADQKIAEGDYFTGATAEESREIYLHTYKGVQYAASKNIETLCGDRAKMGPFCALSSLHNFLNTRALIAVSEPLTVNRLKEVLKEPESFTKDVIGDKSVHHVTNAQVLEALESLKLDGNLQVASQEFGSTVINKGTKHERVGADKQNAEFVASKVKGADGQINKVSMFWGYAHGANTEAIYKDMDEHLADAGLKVRKIGISPNLGQLIQSISPDNEMPRTVLLTNEGGVMHCTQLFLAGATGDLGSEVNTNEILAFAKDGQLSISPQGISFAEVSKAMLPPQLQYNPAEKTR